MVWTLDSQSLLFVARGDLYEMTTSGGTPRQPQVGSGVSALSLSPDGSRIAFLREGDLWTWTRNSRASPERLTSLAVAAIARVPLGT